MYTSEKVENKLQTKLPFRKHLFSETRGKAQMLGQTGFFANSVGLIWTRSAVLSLHYTCHTFPSPLPCVPSYHLLRKVENSLPKSKSTLTLADVRNLFHVLYEYALTRSEIGIYEHTENIWNKIPVSIFLEVYGYFKQMFWNGLLRHRSCHVKHNKQLCTECHSCTELITCHTKKLCTSSHFI